MPTIKVIKIDSLLTINFWVYFLIKIITATIEIIISKVARYESNFTPSTSHFSDDANTVLLIQSNTTDGSTVFRDSSGIAFGLGADSSGEGNHWEMREVQEYDQTVDTPTNNFCTLNPSNPTLATGSITQGNLVFKNTLNS